MSMLEPSLNNSPISPGADPRWRYPISGTSRRNFIRRIKEGLPKFNYFKRCKNTVDNDWVIRACETTDVHDHKQRYDQWLKGLSPIAMDQYTQRFVDNLKERLDKDRMTPAQAQRNISCTDRDADIWVNYQMEQYRHGEPTSPQETPRSPRSTCQGEKAASAKRRTISPKNTTQATATKRPALSLSPSPKKSASPAPTLGRISYSPDQNRAPLRLALRP